MKRNNKMIQNKANKHERKTQVNEHNIYIYMYMCSIVLFSIQFVFVFVSVFVCTLVYRTIFGVDRESMCIGYFTVHSSQFCWMFRNLLTDARVPKRVNGL